MGEWKILEIERLNFCYLDYISCCHDLVFYFPRKPYFYTPFEKSLTKLLYALFIYFRISI